MFISVVIPTYNRKPILEKCLRSLEIQDINKTIHKYEVVVVDDGSTDGTQKWLQENSQSFPHVELFSQDHCGPSTGRNLGVRKAKGDVIVFIDSDLVVTRKFLSSHIDSLLRAWEKEGTKLCFTYGSVINTNNFDSPTSEKYKISDLSWAYFATGNVAIHKKVLEQAGLFDTNFILYGWEDLELGERLRKMGVRLIKCPRAVGYHWHPAFNIDQIPNLIKVERERAKMGLVFYRKHPSFRVKLIIQFTFIHFFIWEFLTFGGLLNEKTMRPLLLFLIKTGFPSIAMELLRVPLNRIFVREIYKEARSIGL
tara:strand:+ start:341 stop:1270 length:930 start_codon:yes stop_codon:yes gene_type:complete